MAAIMYLAKTEMAISLLLIHIKLWFWCLRVCFHGQGNLLEVEKQVEFEIGACNTIITDKYLQYTNDTGQSQIRSVVLSSTHRNVHPEKLVVLINNLWLWQRPYMSSN